MLIKNILTANKALRGVGDEVSMYKIGDTVRIQKHKPVAYTKEERQKILVYAIMGELPPDFDQYDLVTLTTQEMVDNFNNQAVVN